MPRCRVGDKCLVIVGIDAGCEVTCLELLGDDPIVDIGCAKIRMGGRSVWRLDREVRWPVAGVPDLYCPVPFAADSALLPLRGEPDADLLITQARSDLQAKFSSSPTQVSET